MPQLHTGQPPVYMWCQNPTIYMDRIFWSILKAIYVNNLCCYSFSMENNIVDEPRDFSGQMLFLKKSRVVLRSSNCISIMEIVSLMFSSCIHSVLEIRLLRYSWYPCSPHEQLNTQASNSNLSQKPTTIVYTHILCLCMFLGLMKWK